MQPATDPQVVDPQRQAIASLAHATAHEVIALRDAQRRLRMAGFHQGDTILDTMIRERQHKVALMADEVAGHA